VAAAFLIFIPVATTVPAFVALALVAAITST
jgi:hypothetical protein